MDAVFLKLFNMSITASWLILAVILIRFVFKKAPKWVNCALWALVAVRLICPFSFESVLSLVPSTETVPEEIVYSSSSFDPTLSDVFEYAGNNPVVYSIGVEDGSIGFTEYMAPDTDYLNPLLIITSVSSVIWLIGVVALLIYSLVSYMQIRKKVKISMPLSGNILLCDGISSPFILGIIKPKIYLPSDMPEEQRQYVIAHEKAHLKRRDHWWKPLGFLILTVYWFNPLIWVAYILLCRDIELACDERVIKAMGEESKKSYSEALLSCSVPRRMIAACPVAFGEVGVKGRIKNVLSYKKPAFWIIIAAVVISIVAAACFMTNPANTEIGGKVYEASKYYHSSVVDGRKLAEQNIRYSISDDLMMARIDGGYINEVGVLSPLEEKENELVDMVMYELPFYYRIIGFDTVYMHEFTHDAEQGVITYVLLLMRNGDIICGRLPRSEYVMDVFRLTEKNGVDGFGQNLFTVTESGEQSVKEITYGELEKKYSLDVYYFGLSEVKITLDGESVELRDALVNDTITAETIAQNAAEDALLGRCVKEKYGADDNTAAYQYDDFLIVDRTSAITGPQGEERREIYICALGTTYYSLDDFLYSEVFKLNKVYSLDDAISKAINERHRNSHTGEYGFNSFVILRTDYYDSVPNVKAYVQYVYQSYNYVDGEPRMEGSTGAAVVITFNYNGEEFLLNEFIEQTKGPLTEELLLLESLTINKRIDTENLDYYCERKALDYFGDTQSTWVDTDTYIIQSSGETTRSALIHADGTEIIPYFGGLIYPLNDGETSKADALYVEPFREKAYVTDLKGEIIIAPDDYDRLWINSVLGAFEGVKDGTLYVFDSKCNVTETRDKNLKPLGEPAAGGLQLVTKYENNKVTYGAVNADFEVVVPCDYNEITFLSAERILARNGQLDGIEPTDSILIYDADGNVVCQEGEFVHIAFAENAKIGIGRKWENNNPDNEKCWLVDLDGNKLTEEYLYIDAISNNRFMARTSDEAVFYDSNGTEIMRYKRDELGWTDNRILEKSGDYIIVNAERNNLEGYSSKKYGSDRVAFRVDNIDDWQVGDDVSILYKLEFEQGDPPTGELINIMLNYRFE